MTERDERALREALEGLEFDEPVDLGQVRRRAAERRRNGRTVAGLAVALVLVAGVIGLPQLLPGGGNGPSSVSAESGGEAGSGASQAEAGPAEPQDAGTPGPESAETPSTDPAPAGWRTEYYRDISFQVPSSWGYAVPPLESWCANGARPTPRPDQRNPYVWLDKPLAQPDIICPAIPDSMLTEHVVATSPRPATDYAEGAVKTGGFWVVTRFAGNAVLIVTTRDQALAERILASAKVGPEDAPCEPASPVAGPVGTRPDQATDIALLLPVERVVLCQYEPVADIGDAQLPRLRAAITLTGAPARQLVQKLVDAPENDTRCNPAPTDEPPDLAIVVKIGTDREAGRAWVRGTACPDQMTGMAGGIDDGTTVRTLTRSACQALLTPPLMINSAQGEVGRNCLG